MCKSTTENKSLSIKSDLFFYHIMVISSFVIAASLSFYFYIFRFIKIILIQIFHQN